MRVYNLLKQYESFGERQIEVDILREILGIGKDQYYLYADFKKTILLSTQKELKNKADIYFEFDEIKYGRRVGAIRFRIFSKKIINSISDKIQDNVIPIHEQEVNVSLLLDQLLSLVPEQHKKRKTIITGLESCLNKHGFDYVKRNILYSNAKADKSYAGFLNNALKEDWGHDLELEQQMVPTKKKSIEIWERQGFSSQKDYDDFMYRKQMKAYEK